MKQVLAVVGFQTCRTGPLNLETLRETDTRKNLEAAQVNEPSLQTTVKEHASITYSKK